MRRWLLPALQRKEEEEGEDGEDEEGRGRRRWRKTTSVVGCFSLFETGLSTPRRRGKKNGTVSRYFTSTTSQERAHAITTAVAIKAIQRQWCLHSWQLLATV